MAWNKYQVKKLQSRKWFSEMVTGTKLSKDLPRTAKDSTHFAMHAPPTPSEFDETTSLLPCQCFYKFLAQVPSLSNFIPCIFSSPKLLNMRFLRTRRYTRINSTRQRN